MAVCIRQRLPLGARYWFVPKGPLTASGVAQDEERTMIRELAELLYQSRALFLRVEPARSAAEVKRTHDVNPRATVVCDLTRTEDQLMSAMHPKTRYNIKLAERHGLRFRWAAVRELTGFWQLLGQTASRDGFRTHGREHYAALLRVNAPADFEVRLGMVELDGELLAASLVAICQGTATYLHGASSRSRRELMAPYLLHWAAMDDLKRSGVAKYDFWGIQPTDGSLSDWAGFSRFKLGFGGERYEYPGTYDVALRPGGYSAYRLARAVRRALGKATSV